MNGQDTERQKGEGKGARCSFRGVCFLSVALFFMGLPSLAVAAQYGGGTGTSDAPFLISTTGDFRAIGNNPADWNKHFKLMQNIDLSDSNEVNLRMIGHWVALGSGANQPFTGEFDGNGKTISNFTYKDMTDEYVGLFQHVTGIIRNLKLVRATVTGNSFGVGALVGNLDTGSVVSCSATEVNISGNNRVGGLVGSADGAVSSSYSDGSVSGGMYVGGLVGQVGIGNIGLCYSRAKVVGKENVGGLVGLTIQADSVVNSCYATGDVKGTTYVAGLVGQVSAGHVWRCFSAGKVSGSQYVGGLVGYQRALAEVAVSVWDTQTSQQTQSVGGIGKTTAQMQSVGTFLALGWDFNNVWTICDGMHYPVFLWQIPPGDLVCPDGVNFYDFVWFAANWRGRNCGAVNLDCNGADLDKSGSVDLRDLAIFAENWLAGIE
jgi:hypothetical protein